MSAITSVSGPASSGDADASAILFAKEAAAGCHTSSASQEDLLSHADFICGGGGGGEEEEAEVFSTPPLTHQDPERQGQSKRGQAGEGEDGITMRSMPVTQTQPSPSPSSSSLPSDSREPVASKPRKRRVCTRKVRCGAKIKTPPPSPSPSPELKPLVPAPMPNPELDPLAPSPNPIPSPELEPLVPAPIPNPELDPLAPNPCPSPELDPLTRLVLMIPTKPLRCTGDVDIFELARSRGIFDD